jgi:site-specific DNA recombinase
VLAKVLKPGMKGAFYGRHSTDKQEMVMQKNSVDNLVDKYQCKIIKEYLDPAVSATKTPLANRKKLQQLLSDIETQNFDFVIVYKNDRLARDPIEHQFIRTTMNIFGVPVIESATESLYTQAENIIVQLLQDGLTKFEADNIRQRTRDSHITRAKNGQWTGGQAPFGYKYDKETQLFSTYPEELDFVKTIFQLYQKGEGFEAIASALSPKSNTGKTWTKEKVKRIVTNPFYAGFIAWGKYRDGAKGSLSDRENWILTKSDHIEPVIALEEWEYCWMLYQQKKLRKLAPKQFKTSFLLKDLVSCKTCNTLLQCKDQRTTGNNGKKYGRKIYFCPNCNIQIVIEQLHLVIDKILNDIRLNHPNQIQKGIYKRIQEEIETLVSEIAELNKGKVKYLEQIEEVKNEIKVRLDNQGTDHNRKILDILTTYRISLNSRVEQIEAQIFTKEQRMNDCKRIDFNSDTWNPILHNAFRDREKIDTISLRNLLSNLIVEIKVDKNLSVEYQLRHNLEKQLLGDQIELQF